MSTSTTAVNLGYHAREEELNMGTHLEAVYENGVFRPLQPVQLPEHRRVTVTIEETDIDPAALDQVHFALPPERWRAFCEALDAPPRDIPALRKLLTEEGLFDEPRGTAH
jgi:predicted DNA-binding antitoxin AbrB/MazE fold protein